MMVTCLMGMVGYLRVRVAIGKFSLMLDPTDRPFKPFKLTDSLLGYLIIAFLFTVSLHLLLGLLIPGLDRDDPTLLIIDAVVLVVCARVRAVHPGHRRPGPPRPADAPRPSSRERSLMNPNAPDASNGDPAADPSPMERSGTFTPGVIEDIQIKAELARYRIRGFGILRPRTWATFDDLTFIPGTLTRIPLEGYRETCSTKTVLGTRFASQAARARHPADGHRDELRGPLEERQGGASPGASNKAGTSTTTGDGGMLDVERAESRMVVYEVLPSRYGIDIRHLRQADAIELTIGQGAKPGTGGLLLGSKVSPEIARLRDLPPGVDQRSPCRHPDFLGPDDLVIKIEELREATDGQVPIFVKMGASRVFDDVRLAAKAGADVVVVDGMEGGTGASPELLQEHTGIPTLAAVCEARAALRTSASSARSSSSSPAASATAPTAPRPWPWGPTPATSAPRS